MEKQRLDYVTVPRYIMSDYRNGKITKPERNLLLVLRSSGNPYGVAVVTLDGLAEDTFNTHVDKSYINKLLLSLKSKRYIWYQSRTGRRGSFEVHMGDWLLSGGKIKTLNHFFTDEIGRGLTPNKEEIEPEVKVEFHAHSQRFHPKNIIVNKGSKFKQVGEIIRGPNNDTNTEKEKDNQSFIASPKKIRLQTDHFVPENYEEALCLKIATQVGDKQIGFYLSVYRKHGTGVLEEAFDEFERLDGRHKNNPPAFFNSLVQKSLGKRDITIIPFKEDIIVL